MLVKEVKDPIALKLYYKDKRFKARGQEHYMPLGVLENELLIWTGTPEEHIEVLEQISKELDKELEVKSGD